MTNSKELGRGTATFEHAQSFKSLSYKKKKKKQRHFSEGNFNIVLKTFSYFYLSPNESPTLLGYLKNCFFSPRCFLIPKARVKNDNAKNTLIRAR